MDAAARVLHEIRLRRSFMKKRPPRRRRLPRQLPPNAIILTYRGALLALVFEAEQLLRLALLKQLPAILDEARRERGDSGGDWRGVVRTRGELAAAVGSNPAASLRFDAAGKKVSEAMDALRREMLRRHPAQELEDLAGRVGRRTSDFQKEQLHRQLRAAVGVDVLAAEPNLRPHVENFVEENVALIKSLPSKLFDEVEQRVLAGVRAGTRHEELAQEIATRFEVSESRAELVARDQVLTFYGKLNETRQKALGVDGYIWSCSMDERVRGRPDGKYPNSEHNHWAREGRRYLWSEPPADGHPGTPVNCRCVAAPDLEDMLNNL